MFAALGATMAQRTDAVLDSLPPLSVDSTLLTLADSLSPQADTLPLGPMDLVRFSKDSIEAAVEYGARDSMIYDIANRRILLYGQATVSYTTISLEADFITLDWALDEISAEGLPDSVGQMAGLPVFKDADQEFNAQRIRYNFKTRKGIVYEVTTTQGDIVVRGEKSKFVSTEEEDGSRKDIIYSQNAIFTTCTAEHPHFGIYSKQQKVIPNKLVIVGPSNLRIMGVPTPLVLPFGFFPVTKSRSAGVLIPSDYEYSQQWGFGLRDIGWFMPLGEHFNLSIRANAYIRGTWGVSAQSEYNKRYRYRGNFNVGYDVRRSETDEGIIDKPRSLSVQWTHNQDRAAHPSLNFGGSINFQTNSYQERVFNDAASVQQNQFNSNLSLVKNWQDKPLSLSVAFTHSQNSRTRDMSVDFPNLRLTTQALYPFKRKERQGKERWYEAITMRYSGEARSNFSASDTTFFKAQTLRQANTGARHNISGGTSFKLFKYFNLNPGITYEEVWQLRAIEQNFIDDPVVRIDTSAGGFITMDTTALGFVEIDTLRGFYSFRTVNANLTLNTQIFGTLKFKSGRLRGLRHVMKPSISMNYRPGYDSPNLGWYRDLRDLQDPDLVNQYSIFQGGLYGTPPPGGRQMALNYSINNIFEAKYRGRKDSTDKKLKLFDNIVINGSYNFAADSLRWSPVGASGTTRLFKGISTLSLNAEFDPYVSVTNRFGRLVRTNQLALRTNGRPLEFNRAAARLNTAITVGKIRALFQGKPEPVVESVLEEGQVQSAARPKETDFLSLFENFNVSHNLVLNWERDTFFIATHSIDMNGRIALTPNWDINIGGIGYDFSRRQLTYPSFGFSRNLHCWEAGLTWAPTRGTYNFYIQVRPGSLGFLRVPYDRNNADATRAFR